MILEFYNEVYNMLKGKDAEIISLALESVQHPSNGVRLYVSCRIRKTLMSYENFMAHPVRDEAMEETLKNAKSAVRNWLRNQGGLHG